MSNFIQLHVLTSYPPSNLNRDDLGRPKTAVIGGATRLRVSSQSLKRAWRCSDIFKEAVEGGIGTRTRTLGRDMFETLVGAGVNEKKAMKWVREIMDQFGELEAMPKKVDGDDEKRIEMMRKACCFRQLVHFCKKEMAAVDGVVQRLKEEGKMPEEKSELALLANEGMDADIAMFGRMLASKPEFNVEAAVQVAHAVTVHQVTVEDDYFSAVDDLNEEHDETGAGHIGESQFGAGVFYLYLCIDTDLLRETLNDGELLKKTLSGLTRAVLQVSPTGKQNSFASRARASFALAERGGQQPRSLGVSFLQPVRSQDVLVRAIGALEGQRANMDAVYGPCSDDSYSFDVTKPEGTESQLLEFITGSVSK